MKTPSTAMRRLDDPVCLEILNGLENAGGQARFIGGCVRDHLIKRPFFDIDIATTLLPERVMEVMDERGVKTIPTGLDHGTVTLLHKGQTFEVTTLRKDIETNGRHARVVFGTDWHEDAARRDFTMNTLSMDKDATLYDPMGGLSDLKRGIVRFVGPVATRLQEDYLRLLRYFRFQAHYGKAPPEEEVLKICQDHRDGLDQLSSERVRDEFLKLLSAPQALKWLHLMERYEILSHILPGSPCYDGFDMLCAFEDVPDPFRRLALLLDPAETEALVHRFKLSKKQARLLQELHVGLIDLTTLQSLAKTRAQLFEFGPDAVRHGFYLFCAKNGFFALNPSRDPHFLEIEKWRDHPVAFPLKGRDLAGLGVETGPGMGQILARVKDWWLEDGCYGTKEDCLSYARSIM